VETLKGWMKELNRPEDEVLETVCSEGTLHESIFLLEGRYGPIVAHVIGVEDPERAREGYRASALPIDLEHREIMEEVLAEALPVEELLNLRMPGGASRLGSRALSQSADD
jgi:hypothetical protein